MLKADKDCDDCPILETVSSCDGSSASSLYRHANIARRSLPPLQIHQEQSLPPLLDSGFSPLHEALHLNLADSFSDPLVVECLSPPPTVDMQEDTFSAYCAETLTYQNPFIENPAEQQEPQRHIESDGGDTELEESMLSFLDLDQLETHFSPPKILGKRLRKGTYQPSCHSWFPGTTILYYHGMIQNSRPAYLSCLKGKWYYVIFSGRTRRIPYATATETQRSTAKFLIKLSKASTNYAYILCVSQQEKIDKNSGTPLISIPFMRRVDDGCIDITSILNSARITINTIRASSSLEIQGTTPTTSIQSKMKNLARMIDRYKTRNYGMPGVWIPLIKAREIASVVFSISSSDHSGLLSLFLADNIKPPQPQPCSHFRSSLNAYKSSPHRVKKRTQKYFATLLKNVRYGSSSHSAFHSPTLLQAGMIDPPQIFRMFCCDSGCGSYCSHSDGYCVEGQKDGLCVGDAAGININNNGDPECEVEIYGGTAYTDLR